MWLNGMKEDSGLLAIVKEAIVEENKRLRREIERSEQERERFRQETERLKREIEQLRGNV